MLRPSFCTLFRQLSCHKCVLTTHPRTGQFTSKVFYSKRGFKYGNETSSIRELYRKNRKDKIDLWALGLLVIPVSAFCLGTWQVRRLQWKLNLIESLDKMTSADPVDFPEDLSEIADLEYRQVRVIGHFDHSKQFFIGPRSLVEAKSNEETTSFFRSNTSSGYHVITPFKLIDRNLTILVNRGWVPSYRKHTQHKLKDREEDQENSEPIELVGIVRLTEKRQPFAMANRPETGVWINRDVENMAEWAGTAAIFLDAITPTVDKNERTAPQAGQTRINLRNEHFSYIITWYGLSAATAFLWFKQFIYRARTL